MTISSITRTTRPRSRNAFSLTEVLVTSLIILLMATLGVGLALKAKDKSRTVRCLSNFRTLSQALSQYLNECQSLPSDYLPLADTLEAYGVTPETVLCPADNRLNATDSYSLNYVRRRRFDTEDCVVTSCARHNGKDRTTILRLNGSATCNDVVPLTYTCNGVSRTILPGEAFMEGALSVAGSATVTATGLSTISGPYSTGIKPESPAVLTSYRHENGLQTIVMVPPAMTGIFEIECSDDSAVELVTAFSAVVVRNGSATLTLIRDGDRIKSIIKSSTGSVYFRMRDKDRADFLQEGISIIAARAMEDLLEPM